MENFNILERYILSLLYSLPCFYIALKSHISALDSFLKIRRQDTLDNLYKTALYVVVTQLSIINAKAFCNMLSLNLIKIDVSAMITAWFNFCFTLCALYMVSIIAWEMPEEFSVLKYIKIIGFKIVFSLIFLNVVMRLMMYLFNGIYALQVSIYEKILEANQWYKGILIFMFSLGSLNWIFQSNRNIPLMFKDIQTENNENTTR